MKLLLAIALLGFVPTNLVWAEIGNQNRNTCYVHTESTVGNVMNHKAFSGFGQFVLPYESITDTAMKLTQVARLLPYHSYVTGENAVATINHMIDLANTHRLTFFDIYSGDAKRLDERKRNTGLFFFKGKAGWPFAIVSPGGAFLYVGAIHEGFPLAIELSRMGYNVFSLQYRAGGAEVACEDLAQAIDFVMTHSSECR